MTRFRRECAKWYACGVFLAIRCTSPATRELAIYRVNVTQLAEELLKLDDSNNNTHDISDLVHPQLPNFWYYGMSGICDVYSNSTRLSAPGPSQCRHAFPPTQNLLAVVEDSLRESLDSNGTNQEKVITAVLSAWNDTLSGIPSSKLRDKEAKVAVQGKASAALAVLCLLFDFVSFGIASFLEYPDYHHGRTAIGVVSLCSAVMAIAAGVCAILSMNEGIHGIVSGAGNVSGSLLVLFISAVLKVLAVGLCLPPRPRKLTHEEIGLLGEKYIYRWCQDHLPDFSVRNWSSKAHPLEQWKYADFTYQDHNGYMLDALRKEGVQLMPGWSTGTTYHLEVKGTQQECDAVPFFVSPNQVRMMQDYNNSADHAYIVARVFRVGLRKTGVRFFPNPWDLKDRVLEFAMPTVHGDTPVHIRH
ncbi:hypothetical protein B0H66DRAFT_526539 [Apodospora peruviana]|uniref:Uncharacterized protein n=1 Tax=Apodospora peruviana TaxID=516989 RepID=A0AAE0MEV4_9PEZI|nr:hypothetical protein B0H66DRAFT_526539 [Apodospora peruviana]